MSEKRYPGNIISTTETLPRGPISGGRASGVWTLTEAFFYTKQGIWPQAAFRPIGLFAGGTTGSSSTNIIDYIFIDSLGNATDFGDLNGTTDSQYAACASSIRGVFKQSGNAISYVTISSPGNATDFGDLTVSRSRTAALSSETRGCFGGGSTGGSGSTNVIDYITIDTAGNATDFGDLTVTRQRTSACASTTRGVFGGGFTFLPSQSTLNTMDYITIATAGNAIDFGDLNGVSGQPSAGSCSSSTRGLFAGFSVSSFSTNIISYITIASAGNSTDFGDLTIVQVGPPAACSSSTRGVFGGGTDSSSTAVNVIGYVTIATTGNATDFGDLTVSRYDLAACSNAHGGLS